MGRSILVVLLAMILTISRVSSKSPPVPASHCLSSLVHAVHCCLAVVSRGKGGGTLSQQGPR